MPDEWSMAFNYTNIYIMTSQVPESGLIVAVGDLVWDVVVKPNTLLLPGGDTTGQIALMPGGSAANVSVWVARVGGEAGFIGSIGADFFGDAIARDLEAEGVQSWLTHIQERNTGVILVLLNEAGERSHVTNQGADFVLQSTDLPEDILRTARHVHLTAWSLFTDPPRAAALDAARIASTGKATISLDPGSFQMINEMGRDTFLQMFDGLQIDIVLPNRDEATALTGEQEPERAAQVLHSYFPHALIALKLDAEGCYILGPNGIHREPAVPVVAVDTTGAGDAFDATFITRYLQTNSVEQAAQFANKVSAWVVTHTGARPPIDKELRDILTVFTQ